MMRLIFMSNIYDTTIATLTFTLIGIRNEYSFILTQIAFIAARDDCLSAKVSSFSFPLFFFFSYVFPLFLFVPHLLHILILSLHQSLFHLFSHSLQLTFSSLFLQSLQFARLSSSIDGKFRTSLLALCITTICTIKPKALTKIIETSVRRKCNRDNCNKNNNNILSE